MLSWETLGVLRNYRFFSFVVLEFRMTWILNYQLNSAIICQDVLRELKSCLRSDDAFQYAEYVRLFWYSEAVIASILEFSDKYIVLFIDST